MIGFRENEEKTNRLNIRLNIRYFFRNENIVTKKDLTHPKLNLNLHEKSQSPSLKMKEKSLQNYIKLPEKSYSPENKFNSLKTLISPKYVNAKGVFKGGGVLGVQPPPPPPQKKKNSDFF